MAKFKEKDLTKGQLRKLKALRKSLGDDIADKAFAEWLDTVQSEKAVSVDENVEVIANTLWAHVQKGNSAIPRGGYLVRRGRGRVIVEPAAAK